MADQSNAGDRLIDRRTVLQAGAALAAVGPVLLRGADVEAQPRPRGASPAPIIDSQVHAYEANTPKRPWFRVPNWPDHVTGDEMVARWTRSASTARSSSPRFRCTAMTPATRWRFKRPIPAGSRSSNRSIRTIRRWP